jgi:hypothetical protein
MPRCKSCKSKFTATYFLEKFCKRDECKDIEARVLLEKARSKQQKLKADAWKVEKAEHKKTLETTGEAKDKLQKVINQIARLIDNGISCMMCGTPNYNRKNGCHYHSVGSNDTIRFNLHNIAIGCHKCNGEEGGNIIGYDNRLIEVFGREHWEYVKFDLVKLYPYIGLSKPEIHEIRLEAVKIARELEKANLVYGPKVRLRMRTEINKRLGIY